MALSDCSQVRRSSRSTQADAARGQARRARRLSIGFAVVVAAARWAVGWSGAVRLAAASRPAAVACGDPAARAPGSGRAPEQRAAKATAPPRAARAMSLAAVRWRPRAVGAWGCLAGRSAGIDGGLSAPAFLGIADHPYPGGEPGELPGVPAERGGRLDDDPAAVGEFEVQDLRIALGAESPWPSVHRQRRARRPAVLVPGLQHDDELAGKRGEALVLVALGSDGERERVAALDDPAAWCVGDPVAGDLPPLIGDQHGHVPGARRPGLRSWVRTRLRKRRPLARSSAALTWCVGPGP